MDWRMVLIGVAALLGTWLLTGLVRQYALRQRLLDKPTSRSSHSQTTARGGGVAFVIVILLGLWLVPGTLTEEIQSLLLAASLTAAVGFIDDHRAVPITFRMLIYALSIGILLPMLSPVMLAFRFDLSPAFGPVLLVGVLVLGLWVVNLFNFMDGIDGLAAIEGITVGLAAIIVYLMAPLEPDLTLLVLLVFALLGYLPWNWSPAKIFMGDIGSCFLGLLFAYLLIASLNQGLDYFFAWLILLAVFITDATLTLLRRMQRGEKVWLAHRSHAYQHAARRWGHARVSLAAGLINLVWLLPLALLEVLDKLSTVWAMLLAYLPLLIVAWQLRAGLAETPASAT